MNNTQIKRLFNIRGDLLVCLFIVISTYAVYFQVKDFHFTTYDDDWYVTDNKHVKTGLKLENIVWAFSESYAANWHPLTWISLMLDVEIYGVDAGSIHITNVIFHILNSLLLFILLNKITQSLWKSAFVAALFALHPLHVESVAWIAERKDVLSTFFWLSATFYYIEYIKNPKNIRYFFLVFVFVLGLMSKSMLVTFPFTLILLDYWPLNRLKSKKEIIPLLYEKMPLIAFSALSCIITFFSQKKWGAVRAFDVYQFDMRFANAIISYLKYLIKTIFPCNMAIIYPYPKNILMLDVAFALIFILFIFLVSLKTLNRYPWFIVGWLWYLGTLIPVIGIIQVGSQAMADRYTYVPLIGIFIIIAWTIPELFNNYLYKYLLWFLSILIIIVFSSITSFQVKHWDNDITLFRHATLVTENNYIAHNNLGAAFGNNKNLDKAEKHYLEALLINPRYVTAYDNLGAVKAKQGKADDAIFFCKEALKINPNYKKAHNNLGAALGIKRDMNGAIKHFYKALKIDPNYKEAHNNLGAALISKGMIDEAICHYSKALEIDGNYVSAHNNIAIALSKKGKIDESIKHFFKALENDPVNLNALKNLENLVLNLKNPMLYFKIGNLYKDNKNFEKAIEQYQKGLLIKPDYTPALNNLAILYKIIRNEKL